MNTRIIAGAAGVLMASAFAVAPAQANEGLFFNGYGAVNKSMAGAGVAAGFDSMSQATNPASLALVETALTVEVSIQRKRGSHEVTGAPSGAADTIDLAVGQYDLEEAYWVLPAVANIWEIDDSSSWGWAIYSSGGLSTEWEEPAGGLFGGGTAGIDLNQTFLQLTYAQEISPEIYIGFSPILAFQRFRAEGLDGLAAISSDATKLTDEGYDYSWGYGGKIGIQAEIGAGFSVGAAYQTEMFMTNLDGYSGLLADAGAFNVPATLQLGIAWQAEGGFLAAVDYRRIFYGDVAAISNSVTSLDPVGGVLLGSTGGPGFGWDDMDIVKFGVEVPLGDFAKLRAGAAMNTNPVSRTEMAHNLLAMELQDRHYTAGLTVNIGDNHAINLAGMYAPPISLDGENGLEAPGQQAVTLDGSQWEATLGWAWKY